MKTKIRTNFTKIAAALALTLGLAGGAAAVPDVASAAAPGTYDYATQRVCFTTPVTISGGTFYYPYSHGNVRLQVWWNGGPFTIWEGNLDREGCARLSYVRGWYWRVAATDQFSVDYTRVFYGASSDWFWIDGSRASYPTATFRMARGVGWPA